MNNRRAHARLLDCDLVAIQWDDKGRHLSQIANVDDVSLGGMRIRVDERIPVGTPVTISYESLFTGTLKATIRYQMEKPEGVFLGIEFDSANVNPLLVFFPEVFASEASEAI